MIVLPPPPPAAVSLAHPTLSPALRRAFVRDFRRDFPTLRHLSDAQILDTTQGIVDGAYAGWGWTVLHADVQVRFRCSGDVASGVLSLIIGTLAPDWRAVPVTPHH